MKSSFSCPPVVWAAGAMSGTSLDGVDVALVSTDGHAIHEFGPSAYLAYTEAEHDVLRGVLGRWPGPGLEAAETVLLDAHLEALKRLPSPAFLGFHGQTLAHDPRGRGTHQLGDGAKLARRLGRPVVWDFRTADVAAGGEGAPLAPFFHHACARWIGAEAPVVFLNLGGVGNLTWVDPRIAAPEAPGACLAFDTGPANAPINDLVDDRLGQGFDRNGALARAGQVDQAIVERFLTHPFFDRPPPKSLDRDAFADLQQQVSNLSTPDGVATLTAVAAASVARGLAFCPTPPARLLVAGGGRSNPALMDELSARVACPVAPVEDVGLDGDMLEAQAFAYLAVRVARGLATSSPGTTGVRAPVSGGILSDP